jgi:Cys-tRNA(Pro)/Cys-tRNA(Cys) deacylase
LLVSPKRPAGTPALLAAQAAQIAYNVHEYTHDPHAASYGLEAATVLGLAPARVFKTLIAAVDDRQLTVAIVPVTARLNLKALAAAAGGKRAEMADPAAAERATGYVLGGISPLGQRRRLPAVLDASALDHATIFVSGGRRGLEIELAPADLVGLTAATVVSIAS